jgi:hypothetical protein
MARNGLPAACPCQVLILNKTPKQKIPRPEPARTGKPGGEGFGCVAYAVTVKIASFGSSTN